MADQMCYNISVGLERGCFVYGTANGIMTPSEYYVLFGQTAPHRIVWTLVPPSGPTAVGSAILCGVVCIMATSKLQEKTKARLRLLLNGYHIVENYRPNWLSNPETGRNLELDFYLPDVKIGIEVQGRQHYEYVPFFHGTEEDFYKQQQRDEIKRELCEQHGVHFYEVYTIADIDGFIEDAKGHCRDMAFELLKKHTAIKSLSYHAARLHNESKQRHPKKERMAKLTQRILHIAQKYNVPVNSIEADFSISKIEMAFFNKPIVKIKRYDQDGNVNRSEKAAIISVDEGIANLRWFAPRGRHYIDMAFDLGTGWQVPKADTNNWQIKLETLPEALISKELGAQT